MIEINAYQKLKAYVMDHLMGQLAPALTYHGACHILDVLQVCAGYIQREKLAEEESCLLQIGALMHDIGFISTYTGHEERSAEMARDVMTTYGFDDTQIQIVQGLILATKVPQTPKNKLESILCDADLDYLGRKDFWPVSESIFQELQNFGILHDRHQWNSIQVRFLESHRYHTLYARKYRQPNKAKRLKEIRALIR